MRVVLLAVLVLVADLATGRAQEAKLDCAAQDLNQMQLDQCAGRDFRAADAQLNALYAAMMKQYDAPNRALLKAAEQSWLRYRDAECDYETALTQGGTIHSMMVTECRTAKTKARIAELNAQLHCEEGDLSCNAPH